MLTVRENAMSAGWDNRRRPTARGKCEHKDAAQVMARWKQSEHPSKRWVKDRAKMIKFLYYNALLYHSPPH